MIDNMEIGSVRKWEYYRHLLEFYGKELKIELIERNGRIGNGTVKNGGGNRPAKIAEGEKLPPVLSDGCRKLNCHGFSAACSGKLPKGKSCRRCRLTVAGSRTVSGFSAAGGGQKRHIKRHRLTSVPFVLTLVFRTD